MNFVTAAEAVSKIKSHQKVFIHGAAMTPGLLIDAMVERANELEQVELMHMHTEGKARYASDEYKQSFHVNSFFVARNMRKAVDEENADYVPMFLSDVHLLFKNDLLRPDVALIQVSPPDKHGNCTLGASVDVARQAAEAASIIIAEVNEQAPRTHGAGSIPVEKIDFLVHSNRPLYYIQSPELSENDLKIGRYISGLIEDGATLQLGIGGVPDAVLKELANHRNLGIHSEMVSDGIIPLVENGVINGEEKEISRGKIVSSFVLGSQKIYDFIHDNAEVSMRETSYTNDPGIIRMNPKVTAINSAIEIDLTGQVCAESIGTYQFSGVGGQLDFIRAAAFSEGGKPIIAMDSVTKKGESKIVAFLKQGAAVTTTRAHVHYIVTEYGIAYLNGKNLRQRAKALIEIAHPMHREELEKQAFLRFKHL
jgi:acyl-CoA hydrolase